MIDMVCGSESDDDRLFFVLFESSDCVSWVEVVVSVAVGTSTAELVSVVASYCCSRSVVINGPLGGHGCSGYLALVAVTIGEGSGTECDRVGESCARVVDSFLFEETGCCVGEWIAVCCGVCKLLIGVPFTSHDECAVLLSTGYSSLVANGVVAVCGVSRSCDVSD